MGMIERIRSLSLRAWGMVLAFVLALILVWFFWGSEEAALNQRLDDIADYANALPQGRGSVAPMAEAFRAPNFFAPEGVRIQVLDGPVLVKKPDDIRKGALLWAQWSRDGHVSLTKRAHTLPGDDTARTKVWVEIFTSAASTRYQQGTWAELSWKKIDGEWRIVSARELER